MFILQSVYALAKNALAIKTKIIIILLNMTYHSCIRYYHSCTIFLALRLRFRAFFNESSWLHIFIKKKNLFIFLRG